MTATTNSDDSDHSNPVGIASCYFFFVVFGSVGFGILPTLNKSIQDTYGLSHSDLGWLLAWVCVLSIIFNFLGGLITDRIGALDTMLWACGTIAACGVFLSQRLDLMLFLIAYSLFIVFHGLTVAVNALGASYFGGRQAERMSALHGFQGVGRMFAPLLLAGLLSFGFSWRAVFSLCVLGHLICILLFLNLRHRSSNDASPMTATNSNKTPLRFSRELLLGLCAFAFCASLESLYVNWIPVYLEAEAGFSKDEAMYCLSGMMAGYTSVRLAPLWLPLKLSQRSVVVSAAVLMLTALGFSAFGAPGFWQALSTCFVLGLCFGLYWPSTLSLVFSKVPIEKQGTTVGLAVLSSAGGIFLLNPVVGLVADRFSIGTALLGIPPLAVAYAILFRQAQSSPSQAG